MDNKIQLEAKQIFPRPIDLSLARVRNLLKRGTPWNELKKQHIAYWSARYGLNDYYRHQVTTGRHIGNAIWAYANGKLYIVIKAVPGEEKANWETKIIRKLDKAPPVADVEAELANKLIPFRLLTSTIESIGQAKWRIKLITFPIAKHDWMVWIDELYFDYELNTGKQVTSPLKRNINAAVLSYRQGKLTNIDTLAKLKGYLNDCILYKNAKRRKATKNLGTKASSIGSLHK